MGKVKVGVKPIRKLRDLKTLSLLESRNFEYPWTLEEFEKVVQDKSVVLAGLYLDGALKGYICWKSFKDCISIESLLVDHDIRREGYGAGLINIVFQDLQLNQLGVVVLIRETNLEAQLFFKALGFKAVKVIKNSFEECSEDGYLMEFKVLPYERPAPSESVFNTTLSNEVFEDAHQDKSG